MGRPTDTKSDRSREAFFIVSKRITAFGLLFLLCTLSYSEEYYVRMGADGAQTGKTWKDAFTDLPAKLIRGSTYYIADGVYKNRIFNDPEAGTVPIIIRKAIPGFSDTCRGNLNDSTWDDSYGVGTAIFTSDTPLFDQGQAIWQFTTGYYTIDGRVGSDTSGYGIKLLNGNSVFVPTGRTTNNLVFRYIQMQGDGWLSCTKTRGFQISGDADNCTLQYCYIYDFNQQLVQFAGLSRNILMERCYLLRASSGCSELHSVMFWSRGGSDSMNVVIRYNVFENMGSGGGTGYISLGYLYSGPSRGYEIYGNIFRSTSEMEGPSRLLGENGDAKTRGVKFFHNTIVGLRKNAARITFNSNDSSDNLAYNNLWVNCETHPHIMNMTAANNSLNNLAPNVFTDPTSGNYRLAKSVDLECKDLGYPYNRDPDGNLRGADKVTDAGAYEFLDISPPPKPFGLYCK